MKLFLSYFGPAIATAVFVVVLRACVQPAMAGDVGACYNIADSDARTYCIAKARQEPAQCYSIQSAALRSMCLAEVRR